MKNTNDFTWVNLKEAGFITRPAKRILNNSQIIGIEIADLNNVLPSYEFQKQGFQLHKINKTNVLNVYWTDMRINTFVEMLSIKTEALEFYKTSISALNAKYADEVKNLSSTRFKEAINNATFIGLNSDLNSVFATPYSRFFTNDPKNFSDLTNDKFEGHLPSDVQWKILKAGSDQSHKRKNISLCALGYAHHALQSNIQLHDSDIDQFLKVILNQNQDQNYEMQINPAQKQFFYEQLETAFNLISSRYDVSNKQDFEKVVNLHLHQPTRKILGVSELQMQQFSTPITIAAIAQKLLLSSSEYKTTKKSILEPTIGNGSLVSQFVDVPLLNIVGTEIDSNRVRNLQAFFNANLTNSNLKVVEGDFSKISVLQLNNNNKYDFTIANPPFGSIDKTAISLITADDVQINFSTQRLDHKILLDSLNLRQDFGRSVFIIGSDSFYEKGTLKGGSKNLFNFLYDNYNVEGAIELDGSLYKKQGTKTNVRLLIIGEKLEKTRKFDVPEILPILRSEHDLWDWSEQVINQRLLLESNNTNELNEDLLNENNLGSVNESRVYVESTEFLDKAKGLGLDPVLEQALTGIMESENIGGEQKSNDENPNLVALETDTNLEQHKNKEHQTEINSKTTLYDEDNAQKDELILDLDEHDQRDAYEFKSLQVPYLPVSQVSAPDTMIPSDQALLIKQAQDVQLEVIHSLAKNNKQLSNAIKICFDNPFDGFILHKLKYADHAALSKAFSAEQVDALTGAILTFEDNRSFILGDQTGIGKGRTLAGILRYSLLNNERPIFFTRNAQLFSDLWRDLEATDTAKLIKNPFIFNADGAISFNDEIVHHPIKSNDIRNLKEIDKSYDAIFSTYSQFSGRSRFKEDLLLKSVDRNTRLLLDESHVAASGESNISLFMNSLKSNTADVYYSSATSLKKAKNFNFYSDIFPKAFHGQLKSILENQPSNEILEAISMALAKDGVFMRREHDFSKLEFRTYDAPSHYQVATREISDQLSTILSKMAYLSGDVDEKVAKINADIKNNIEHAKEGGVWQNNRLHVNSMNFSSRMHNLSRQIILAVTTPLVIDQALVSLSENRKPVIGLENTGESLLKMLLIKDDKTLDLIDQVNELKNSPDFSKNLELLSSGAITLTDYNNEKVIRDINELEFQISKFNQLEVTLPKAPSVSDLLNTMLDRLDTIQVRDRYGSVRTEKIVDKKYMEFKDEIKLEIEKLPEIPLCPLDMIINELEEKGYKVGEISGREFRLKKVESNDGIFYKVEKREENSPLEKTKACNAFQSGKLDVMILSRSGSTGLSLHAIPVNGGEQNQSDHLKQREFLTAQSPQAIDEFLQLIGRVDRKGQVSHPIISQFNTGLPIQRKFLMMHNAKLSELSANITSNRENINKQVTDVDLLNKYGDDIAYQYLKNNIAVRKSLFIDLPDREDKEDTDGMIKKIFNRLNFVPINTQERIIDDLTFAYNEKIQKLNEMGINPFVVKICDWKAKTLDKQQIQSGLGIHTSQQRSAFFEPSFYQRVEYQTMIAPFKSTDIKSFCVKGSELMKNQLSKHLLNFQNNSETTFEDLKKLQLSTLLKLYSEAQHQVLAEQVSLTVGNLTNFGYLKNKLDDQSHASTLSLIKQGASLDELKKIIEENIDLYSPAAQLIKKIEPTLDFIRKLQLIAENNEDRVNVNFAVKSSSSLFDFTERDSFENVLIRVSIPKLKDSLNPYNFEIKHTYPSSDYLKTDKLKHLLEDASLTDYNQRNAGSNLFLSLGLKNLSYMKDFENLEVIGGERSSPMLEKFNSFEPQKIIREATLLTGNIISALNVAAVSKVYSQTINYTDEEGLRQRALLMPSEIDFNTLTNKVKGLSSIQEAIIYMKAIEDNVTNNIKQILPDFMIVKSNSGGNPVLQIVVKPVNNSTNNYTLTVQGSRSQIKQFSELKEVFMQANKMMDNSLNLDLKGDLSMGSKSTQSVNLYFLDVRKLLSKLSQEFSTVKISNLDEGVLKELRSSPSDDLIQTLKS